MRTVTPRRRLQRRAPSTLTDRARRRLEEKTAKAQLEIKRRQGKVQQELKDKVFACPISEQDGGDP